MRYRRALLPLVLVASSLSTSSIPAQAYRPEATPDRHVRAEVEDALAHRAVGQSRLGLLVHRDGAPLLSRNPDKALIPASLNKLATTVAAIERFGPDHRFATVVRASGGTNRVPRTLILVGGGDPTLSTEAYRRRRFLPKPTDRIQRRAFASGSPTVEQLAEAIRNAGITRVSGDLVANESLFDNDRVPDGWPSRYFIGEPECSYLSALVVNEGRTDLTRKRIVANPALHAARSLRNALKAKGITVGGTLRVGRTPAGAAEVARVESPPVDELVDFIDRYSANFQAEMLFKALGAIHGKRGSYAEGARVTRASIDALGISTVGLIMRDGSGLSRDGRMTVRTLVQLLDAIRGRPKLRPVFDALPIAGGPGTLERRLTGWPTGGNLRAKTGLLRGVRALAGILRDQDGAFVTYAAIFNEGQSAVALGAPLDLLTLAFAFHPAF